MVYQGLLLSERKRLRTESIEEHITPNSAPAQWPGNITPFNHPLIFVELDGSLYWGLSYIFETLILKIIEILKMMPGSIIFSKWIGNGTQKHD